MSRFTRSILFALFLAASPLALAAHPDINSFDVEQVSALDPGTELTFRLEGTPKARASLRIAGVPRTIVLKETSRGEYEGTYTIRKSDRIPSNATVTATLAQGKKRTVARLGESLLASGAVTLPTPAQPQTPAPANVAIERFTVDQIERFEPGTELKFTLTGTPKARASYTIENVVANRAMEEVRAGVYEGTYTIRRQDNFAPGMRVTGTLQANGQVARSQLDRRIVNDSEPPSVRNVSPRDDDVVAIATPIVITGNFDDANGTGVDPKSVRITFDGRDVTGQSTITPQGFSYRAGNLTAGNHVVEVRARDYIGNASRTSWNFRATGESTITPVGNFPLDVLSPANNAEVASGPIEVRGRTIANAVIDVEVTANASVGGLFGVTQRIYQTTLRSDGQGYFGFSFNPPVNVPGARYEVNLRANKDNESRERKLVLIQRR